MTKYSWVAGNNDDSWSDASDWSPSGIPGSGDQAVIGAGDSVTVNSTDAVGELQLGYSSSGNYSTTSLIVATDLLDINASSFIYTDATLNVDIGAWLYLTMSGTVDNAGALVLGYTPLGGSQGNGNLGIDGSITLDGGGTIYMGGFYVFIHFADYTAGSIVDDPSNNDPDSLTNVDNKIVGGGSIDLTSFDNQAKGEVIANQSGALNPTNPLYYEYPNALTIDAETFTNEGTFIVDQGAILDFGQDGATRSLVNTGSIQIGGDAELAISGAFTISGSSGISMKGAGGDIVSDGRAAATFTNESTIGEFSSGQIGDAGIYGRSVNDLTFDNAGTVAATGSGDTLTLNTGANAIGDSGTLEAENGGTLAIDSVVDTGVAYHILFPPPPGGTIEAAAGGLVTLDAMVIALSVVIDPIIPVAPGQVVIDGGRFEMLAGASDYDPVEFTGTAGVLELAQASTTVGPISGFGSGDVIELNGYNESAAESVAADVLTITDGPLSQTFDLEGATYATAEFGVIQVLPSGDYVSLQTSFAGGGYTLDLAAGSLSVAGLSNTAGAFDQVYGSNGTVDLNGAQAVVTAGADTIDFIGGSGDAVTVADTFGHFDGVNGSNGTVYLTNGQAVVTGETNTVDFVFGLNNQVTVAGDAGHFDAVNNLGSNGTVYLTGGQAVVTGGANTIDFVSGAGDAVTVAGTALHFDAVNDDGANGAVYLTGGQAVVTGDDNTVDFISGSGDAVTVAGDALVSDQVNDIGASGTVYLTSGQAKVTGDSDTIEMMGTSTATQSGASDAFVFQAAIGVEKIIGFGSTDSMQFSTSDFANFAAMLSHTFQSGSATVIKLDATDKVTLTNTLDTSLVASQFHFV